MEINCYEDFVRAIKGAQKQGEYIKGSKEYDLALGKLLVTDKARYEAYSKQLRQAFDKQKKRTEIEDR